MTPGAWWSRVTVGTRLTLAAGGSWWSRESLGAGVSFLTIDTRSTWLSGERGGGEGSGRGGGVLA